MGPILQMRKPRFTEARSPDSGHTARERQKLDLNPCLSE